MFRNFPSYREIIRKRISFISLWKEAYLPPRADGPSTSKGGTGSLICDHEQESGRTPQTTTEIIACFVAALLPSGHRLCKMDGDRQPRYRDNVM